MRVGVFISIIIPLWLSRHIHHLQFSQTNEMGGTTVIFIVIDQLTRLRCVKLPTLSEALWVGCPVDLLRGGTWSVSLTADHADASEMRDSVLHTEDSGLLFTG